MSRDSATLLDMLKAARLVVEFREGMEDGQIRHSTADQTARTISAEQGGE